MEIRTPLLLASGFAGGIVVGMWLASPAPKPPPPPPPSATAPAVSAAPVSAAPLRRARPSVQTDDLDACRRSAAFLAGQLQTYEGVPQTWPEGVAASFTAEQLRARLTAAWSGQAEVRAMDCDEYPCLVELHLTTGEQSCCAQLDAALPPDLAAREGNAHITGTDAGMFAVVAFGDPGQWSDDIAVRTSWRVDEAGSLLSESLADEASQRGGEQGK